MVTRQKEEGSVRRIVMAGVGTTALLVLLLRFDASNRDASAEAAPIAKGTATVSGTFTGDAVPTRHGQVQVRIVIENGRITKAEAIDYPRNNHKDQEINSWVVPKLEQATLDTNGTGIDSYSGATVTSEGYQQSLQSALDQAAK
ncbi:MAG: hypothetical protein QG622_3021 [Actinomycetota bacterium]|nr:hypothetical protein [Actinomycetota bacterium]